MLQQQLEIFLCSSSYSSRILRLIHLRNPQCKWVLSLHLFLTHTICVCHLTGVKSCASFIIFLVSLSSSLVHCKNGPEYFTKGSAQVFIIFTNPSARAGYDTRSVFKRSLTGLNSEFSFSQTSCLTKAEEPCLPYYLPIAGGRIIGFIPFPSVLVLCETQSVRSRIWTRVVMSISCDDNHYTTDTSRCLFLWWDFCWRCWFRDAFSFFWCTLYLFFLHQHLSDAAHF